MAPMPLRTCCTCRRLLGETLQLALMAADALSAEMAMTGAWALMLAEAPLHLLNEVLKLAPLICDALFEDEREDERKGVDVRDGPAGRDAQAGVVGL